MDQQETTGTPEETTHILIETRPQRLLAARYADMPFPNVGPVQEIASNALKLRDKDTCTFPKTNCGDTFCDATSEVCAEVQPQSSPPRKACQAVPPQCSNDHSCGCVGKAVCGTGIYTCIDVNAENTVLCTCPNC